MDANTEFSNEIEKVMITPNEVIHKCENIAKANFWNKNGKERVYIEYDNRKFYIDFTDKKNIKATYGYGIKGNIWVIGKLLDEVKISYEPFEVYDMEIKLL